MTDILPRPKHAPVDVPRVAGPSQRRTLDCDVCVVGDDVVARTLSQTLAAQGRAVVRVPCPADTELPVDPVLAPGFALPARELAERVGAANAADLLALTREAAASARDLALDLGIDVEAKGAVLAAPPAAAADLQAEQAAMVDLSPGASRLIGARDLEGLLGTAAFVQAIGLVPAVRVARGAFAQALGQREEEAGVRLLAPQGLPSFDLKGLRKYVDVVVDASPLRIRAFDVILCGTAALRRGAPDVAANLAARPFVAGRVPLGAALPFGGRVQAVGARGQVFHGDGQSLVLALETAVPVWRRWVAGRMVRREAYRLYPDWIAGPAGEARSGTVMRTRHLMPLAGEVDKGVWVAGGLAAQPLSVALMVADLLAEAIIFEDERIALLKPFLEPEPSHAIRSVRATARALIYTWLARLKGYLAGLRPRPAQASEVRLAKEGAPDGRSMPRPKARDDGHRSRNPGPAPARRPAEPGRSGAGDPPRRRP